MKKKIALLSVLWVLIAGVWFVGLNWTRWIAGDGAGMRESRTQAEVSDVVYTLNAADGTDKKTEGSAAPVLRSADGTEEELPQEAVPDNAAAAQPADGSPDPSAIPAADPSSEENGVPGETEPYILNTNTKKIHLPGCPSIADIKEKNRAECDDPEAALAEGYEWCKRCHG
jgi:hypothetical protein